MQKIKQLLGRRHAFCTLALMSPNPQDKPVGSFDLRVEQVDGYEFRVIFDKEALGQLLLDEPPPLGKDRGPNPSRLLAAAVGTCLSASLEFCLSRSKIQLDGLVTEIHTELVRNERRRLRIGKLSVTLRPSLHASPAAIDSCLQTFEDFCVVTESVRHGVPIDVHVEPTLDAGAKSDSPQT